VAKTAGHKREISAKKNYSSELLGAKADILKT
jgi:hypothetical protein